jgi:hypothetical protein
MYGAILPLTQYAFMAWYSVKKAQQQLYLYHRKKEMNLGMTSTRTFNRVSIMVTLPVGMKHHVFFTTQNSSHWQLVLLFNNLIGCISCTKLVPRL